MSGPAKRFVGVAVVVGMACSAALATSVDVSVLSGGNASITVAPGALVPYEVFGVLSDGAGDNMGLALILFDLSLSGPVSVTLTPVIPTLQMASFVSPEGINNPAGYGGTPIGDDRVQCGGAQNSIKNDAGNAPFPVGTVVEGIAWPPDGVTFATGTLTAPVTEGTYTLAVSNVAASVLGEDLTTHWTTSLATAGALTGLTIEVESGAVCGLDAECDDAEPCTADACLPGDPGADPFGCVNEYRALLYGDIAPIFGWEDDAPPQPDLDDILCLIDGFGAGPDWATLCAAGDLWDTVSNACGVDGEINLDDIIKVLDAFGGNPACPAPCP